MSELTAIILTCALVQCQTLAFNLATPPQVVWHQGPWVPTLVCGTPVVCYMVWPPTPRPEPCAGNGVALAGSWRTTPDRRVSATVFGTPLRLLRVTRPGASPATQTSQTSAVGVMTYGMGSIAPTGTLDIYAESVQGCVMHVRVTA